jgi:hypothetical protein
MVVKKLDELGEVGERAGQPIDLIDDDNVDLPRPNLLQERLQRWTLQRGAGKAAIVEFVADEFPAFMRLALDIGFAGFALGVERVEGEIEIVLGGFARVDRAALGFGDCRLHPRSPATPSAEAPCNRGRTAPQLDRLLSVNAILGVASCSACAGSSFPRRPKKRGPFQLVPVIFRAMADRLE